MLISAGHCQVCGVEIEAGMITLLCVGRIVSAIDQVIVIDERPHAINTQVFGPTPYAQITAVSLAECPFGEVPRLEVIGKDRIMPFDM
jgi:hypothetical protein